MLFTSPADSDLGNPVFPSNQQDKSIYERFTAERVRALHEELELSYMYPEMTEVKPDVIAATAALKAPNGETIGITIWFLKEPQPTKRKETIQQKMKDCTEHNVPLGFITNYISQMRQVVRDNKQTLCLTKRS
jgi:hypothetical protein